MSRLCNKEQFISDSKSLAQALALDSETTPHPRLAVPIPQGSATVPALKDMVHSQRGRQKASSRRPKSAASC